MLCRGSWMEAIAAFLLTVAALEIMLHRALAQFDAPSIAEAPKRRRVKHAMSRPATAATD
jgi:hypothetical protein